MDVVGTVAEVVIGAIFVVAGASKVARGAEWPVQAAEMGVGRPVAGLVPWWEILIGALVAVGLGSPWPALAAFATLAGFTAAIVVQLRRGRHPQCACFGAWSTAPLGVGHVWRNLAFLAIAAVAVGFG
ncbi:MAG: DoxX family membrane protein [Acidimicrobiales bacterium]|nr:DoxX family membrane protein [Acidimicrobiales bacterium]MCB9394987.1 DoxX family membrane protein [Acidimicrobiaceae bacterium]